MQDRLAVRPDDAAEIMAGWPGPDSPLWTPELRWLLDRAAPLLQRAIVDHLRAGRHWYWRRGRVPI